MNVLFNKYEFVNINDRYIQNLKIILRFSGMENGGIDPMKHTSVGLNRS